ncbi:MAG: hypothetical protein HYR56_09750 [Acidobacteria bacterium]|nr:hypothetical protein [Acidobacteriota bacterium]MBI3425652.1 hypothetical protein [Acidobacteriota bacterium]
MAHTIRQRQTIGVCWLACFLCLTNTVWAQTTAFTYQGRLTDAGQPANGTYDLQFKLFDSVTVGTGTQQGATLVRTPVAASAGIFTVTLDFGANVFGGPDRFLEIGVRPAGSVNAYTVLAPRQPILSAPYAIQSLFAVTATIATTAVNFSGALAGDVTGTQSATVLSNNAVTTPKLADGSVTNAKIADVAGSKISGSLTSATIPGANVTGAVANATNATNAVTSVNFSGALAGDVTGTQGATTVQKLRNLPLPTPVLADNGKVLRYKNDGVNPASFELAADANSGGTLTGVTAGTGLSGGGTSGNVTVGIAAGGVSVNELAANAVTTAKLTDGSVTDAKITTVAGSKVTGTIPVAGVPAGSANYIQNSASLQAGSNFNISGNGFIGGNLGIGITIPTSKLHVLSNTGGSIAVYGESATGPAVYGKSTSSRGVYGESDSFIGVWGKSTSNRGVYGESTNMEGVYGFSQSGTGVYGESATDLAFGAGVIGKDTGFGNGVLGLSAQGTGVYGQSLSSYAVYGDSNSGPGVNGTSVSNDGVRGYSTTSSGVYGQSDVSSLTSGGVYGYGRGSGSIGVIGEANLNNAVGVFGVTTSATGVGVYGRNNSGRAGVFEGAVAIGNFGASPGNLSVAGTVTKGGGAFKIDHPLDPENKYLYHSFVESPEMMNIYNGNLTTDDQGNASVTMPEWFEALNRDFRYQLTVIGQFAQAIVAEEIHGNQFKLKTSLPNVKVSWQVTGVRQDAFARKHRIPVEELKSEEERGTYLHADAFGQPEERSLDWAMRPEMMKQQKEQRERGERAQNNKDLAPATRPNNR